MLACLVFYITATSIFACDAVDDAGHSVHLQKKAIRIITLAPDITEIVFAIGAGQDVVGVVSGSDYPAKARQLPIVGSYQGLDLERILALKPDLIITWKQNFSRQLAILEKQGIPIYRTDPKQLEDIPRTMQRLGCLTGQTVRARESAKQFLHALSLLKKRYQHVMPVTVFFQIGDHSLLTINHESWINEVISLCGGRNIFADASLSTPEVSMESLLSANPTVILNGAMDDGWKADWRQWPTLTAVKRHNLFTINPDWIDRAGPRLILAAAEVCRVIAGERPSNSN